MTWTSEDIHRQIQFNRWWVGFSKGVRLYVTVTEMQSGDDESDVTFYRNKI